MMPGLPVPPFPVALIAPGAPAEAPLPPAVLALRIKDVIEATLDAGFTTVRDAGGLDWGFKEAVRLGLIRGPRIFISGAFISQTGGHGDHRARTSRATFPAVPGLTSETILADGADGVRRAAREVLRRGADQVKVMASGGAASPTGEVGHVPFSVPELGGAGDGARAGGSYVLAHGPWARGVPKLRTAGVRSVEHA